MISSLAFLDLLHRPLCRRLEAREQLRATIKNVVGLRLSDHHGKVQEEILREARATRSHVVEPNHEHGRSYSRVADAFHCRTVALTIMREGRIDVEEFCDEQGALNSFAVEGSRAHIA
jgi:hypothetical protein